MFIRYALSDILSWNEIWILAYLKIEMSNAKYFMISLDYGSNIFWRTIYTVHKD